MEYYNRVLLLVKELTDVVNELLEETYNPRQQNKELTEKLKTYTRCTGKKKGCPIDDK